MKDELLLEKLNQFYIYANEGLYVNKVIKHEQYTMAYSEYVKDFYSNFIIDINSHEKFDEIEKEIIVKMQEINRTPCYIITPLSKLYKDRNLVFDNIRFDEVNNEVWQIYENFENIDKIESKCTLNVKLEKTTDMKKLAKINYESFNTGDELDPYGDFDSGYLKMYENYVSSQNSKYDREFYFIKVNDNIVGCTMSVFDDQIFGIYGLAIMKEYRRQGIGTEAIKQQLSICKNKNKKIAFLQTEEGFYPSDLYRKIGFKDICNVYYYTLKN